MQDIVDCDGPTAVAYLGWNMGLRVTHAKAANSADKILVFAVSGAAPAKETDRKTRTRAARLRHDQSGMRLRRSGRNQARFTSTSTKRFFFLAGGLNDRGLPAGNHHRQPAKGNRNTQKPGRQTFHARTAARENSPVHHRRHPPEPRPATARPGSRDEPKRRSLAESLGRRLRRCHG